MTEFDMPSAGASFEKRGGWVVNALMREFNLHGPQAAAIVGNCGFESGGFEKLQEIGVSSYEAGGYGWPQWTGPRRRAFEAWCAEQGLEPASDQANYGYLVVELRGAFAYCLNALRRESTIEQCVFIWGRLYEGPGGTTATHLPGYEGRLQYARRALAGSLALPDAAVRPATTAAAATPPVIAAPDSAVAPKAPRADMKLTDAQPDASDAEAQALDRAELDATIGKSR